MRTKTILGIALGLVLVGGICFTTFGIPEGSESRASEPTDHDRAVEGVIQHIDKRPRSAFQDELLREGTLTEEEYDLAFAKFADCATAAGVVLHGDRTKNQWGVYDAGYTIPPISYGVPNSEARRQAEACNEEYFDVVGERWQAAHMVPQEAIDAEFAKLPACMQANGLVPPTDRARGWGDRYLATVTLDEGLRFMGCVHEANRNLGMPRSAGFMP